MQRVFDKFSRFDPVVVERIANESEQLKAEQAWLDVHFGQEGCLNLSPFADRGATRGSHRSEETRRKIGDAQRGRPFTEEHKQKLRDASRKRWDSHPMSDETKLRMSAAHRGKTLSNETRKKLSDLCTERGGFGPRKHADATRAKMKDSQRARRAREALKNVLFLDGSD
jgi:hypothetical protein